MDSAHYAAAGFLQREDGVVAVVAAAAGMPGIVAAPVVGDVWAAGKPAASFWIHVCAGDPLPDVRADLAVCAAGTGAVSPAASHAAFLGRGCAVAVRAEAASLCALRTGAAGVGGDDAELPAAGGSGGFCAGELLRRVSDRSA